MSRLTFLPCWWLSPKDLTIQTPENELTVSEAHVSQWVLLFLPFGQHTQT